MISGKLCLPTTAPTTPANRDAINALAKKIQSVKLQYNSVVKLGKDYKCYSQSCNMSGVAANSNTITLQSSTCYSPLCMQRSRIRKELFLLLRKANTQFNNNSGSTVSFSNILAGLVPLKKPSILEQKLTAPKTVPIQTSTISQDTIQKNLETAVACATKCDDDLKNVFIPRKLALETDIKEVKTEKQEEHMDVSEIDPRWEVKKQEHIPEKCDMDVSTSEEINVTDDNCKESGDSPPRKKAKISDDGDSKALVGNNNKSLDDAESEKKPVIVTTTNQVTTTTTTTTQQTMRIVDGVVQSVQSIESSKVTDTTTVSTTINGTGKTIQTLNAKSSAAAYNAQQNRRFCLKTVKREERVFKAEHAEDGSERIYSTVSTEGKVYLKKVTVTSMDRKKKRVPVKYPLCSTFQTRKGVRSIMVLPQHEVRKLARYAGRISVSGFHAMAKPNNAVWPYPCSRPLFKTCWLYRTVNLRSLAAASLQLRIMWACLRWDDMQVKPLTTDGKHQITTDTDIITMEMLKHRHIGRFLERTQYLRRKIVIPLELPKTVRGM